MDMTSNLCSSVLASNVLQHSTPFVQYDNSLSLGYLNNSRSEKRKLIVERFDREGLHQLQNSLQSLLP